MKANVHLTAEAVIEIIKNWLINEKGQKPGRITITVDPGYSHFLEPVEPSFSIDVEIEV